MSGVWMRNKVISLRLRGQREGVKGLMIECGGGGNVLMNQRNKTCSFQKLSVGKCYGNLCVFGGMLCLIYLFLAGLRTSLFSLETASVLSHSNLKIEMSLLGCIAVIAATSFGLFNCTVHIYKGAKNILFHVSNLLQIETCQIKLFIDIMHEIDTVLLYKQNAAQKCNILEFLCQSYPDTFL